MVEKELGLFQNKQCRININFKVTSFDVFERYLLFGDDRGYIFCYEMNETTNDCTLESSVEFEKKGKIEQLKVHPVINIGYALIGGVLHIFSIPKLDKIYKTESNLNIQKFALNNYHSKPNEILLVSKKKNTFKFYEYSQEMRKLLDSKYGELMCPNVPDLIEWYNNYIYIIAKKKSSFIKVENGKYEKLDYDISYFKNINGPWLVYTNEIGIFMEKGNPIGRSTIDFGNKPLVCFNLFKNFIVSLHDCVLKIFDANDAASIQDVNFSNNGTVGRYLTIGNKNVFYIVQNLNDLSNNNPNSYQLFILKELAFNKQIDKLLCDQKYEEALVILNNNINSVDEEKPKKLEQFYLDSAWVLLKKGDFRKSMMYFKLTNFDPLALIYLFVNELRISLDNNTKSDNINNNNNNTNSLEEYIKNMNYSIETITSNNTDLIKEALTMLYHLLIDKRNYFLNSYKDLYYGGSLEKALRSNQKITFMSSEQAIIDLDDYRINLMNNLEIIDTALIKIMVKNCLKFSLIRELIKSEHFYWNNTDIFQFLNFVVNSKESRYSNDNSIDIAKVAMAYLYEKLEKWENALNIWQDFGQKRESSIEFSLEAKERTKFILNKSQDKDLFKQYVSWMLVKFPDDAFKLFLTSFNEIIQIDYFYTTILGNVDKSYSNLNLKEKFLESYIKTGNINERYHTMLANLYIDKLFSLKPADTELELNFNKINYNNNNSNKTTSSNLEGNIKMYYEKLTNLIKTSNLYDKEHILEKVKDSWMIDIDIYLLSSLNRHSQAIKRLVSISNNEDIIEKAEKYCIETKALPGFDLLGELFIILCNNYNEAYKALSIIKSDKDKVHLELNLKSLKKGILNLMKKYGDSTNKLDPFLVLNNIPGDWIVSEQTLYEYLIKIIKNSNHMSNKYKIARSLSEISLLYKEKEVIEAKNKSVTIGNETNCEKCGKRIGSTIFVVYPNMKIFHTKCAHNLSICPVTRTDFSKNQTSFIQ